MAKQRNRAVDYLVYLIVRIIVCVIQALPIGAGYAFAFCLARFAYMVDKRHRQVAKENLRHAFGDEYSDLQRTKMVLAVYEHFARMIIEIVHIPRKVHVSNWKKYAHLRHPDIALQAIFNDRPTIIVTAHFGNWEMAGFLLAAIGLKSYAIARDLDNPYLHKFLMRFREWTGQTILSKQGDFDKIQRVLSTGGLLISVGDQSAGPRGHFVDFFNRPASAHKAIAILAMRFNAQIIVGYAYRDQPGFHFTLANPKVVDPLDYAESPNAAWEITRDFTKVLEGAIREAPEQYLWLHNRWKHQPPKRNRSQAAKAA